MQHATPSRSPRPPPPRGPKKPVEVRPRNPALMQKMDGRPSKSARGDQNKFRHDYLQTLCASARVGGSGLVYRFPTSWKPKSIHRPFRVPRRSPGRRRMLLLDFGRGGPNSNSKTRRRNWACNDTSARIARAGVWFFARITVPPQPHHPPDAHTVRPSI